jgi:hypothetical protein
LHHVQKIIRAFCDALDRARRFGRHEGGSMAIFTALTDIPLVFSVGAGVDYSASNMARAKLDGRRDRRNPERLGGKRRTGTLRGGRSA